MMYGHVHFKHLQAALGLYYFVSGTTKLCVSNLNILKIFPASFSGNVGRPSQSLVLIQVAL